MDHPLFLPAEPHLSSDQLIAKLILAEVFPEQEDGLMKYAEQVPIEKVLPARDLMRGPGGQHFDRGNGTWQPLVDNISQQGILSPLFLEWSTADGYAYFGEGNTRIAVAQELGLPTVPVVVYRKSLPLKGESRVGEIGPFEFNKRQYLLDQGMTEDMPSWEFKLNDGYVPQYFQPHYLIGFMDQRTAGRLDLPDKYRDEDDWYPYDPGLSAGQLATFGPFYHGTYTENVPSILQHGLLPRDQVPTGQLPGWHETLMPMPGHVYLKTEERPYELDGPETVLRIDPTKLDPTKFRQDEDLKGEWGDDVWGALSSGYGTVAYEGAIPPEAISIHGQYDKDGNPMERTAGSDPWDDMFSGDRVEEVMRARPFAFIHSPTEKWIKWTGPNGLHQEIENDIYREGGRVPDDAIYGRYYPQGGPGASGQVPPGHIEIYDGRYSDEEKEPIKDLIRLNAPDHA